MKYTGFLLSSCYLKGFSFEEAKGAGILGERGKNPKIDNSGRICAGDDISAQ
jgi:hypothetical protein